MCLQHIFGGNWGLFVRLSVCLFASCCCCRCLDDAKIDLQMAIEFAFIRPDDCLGPRANRADTRLPLSAAASARYQLYYVASTCFCECDLAKIHSRAKELCVCACVCEPTFKRVNKQAG